MKKRVPGEKSADESWVDTEKQPFKMESRYGDSQDVTLDVNKYFIKHPENVLGIASETAQ